MPNLLSNYEHRPSSDVRDWATYPARALVTMLSPGRQRSRLSILIYHRVLPQRDILFPDEVDAKAFDEQMHWLKGSFNIIPLTDAIRAMRNDSLPPRPACITFDDGYADNEEIAFPILKKHGAPATFFVATGFLDGGRMWNDSVIELVRRATGPRLDLSTMGLGIFEIDTVPQRRQVISELLLKLKYLPLQLRQARIDEMCNLLPIELPPNLMMRSDQVRGLHCAGMEIGGHTVNHPILASLDHSEARREIAEGREALENIIRSPVRLFAYPNGKPSQDYRLDHVRMVKDLGFEGAVSTAGGVARCGDDLYQLPRFTPWDKARLRFTLRMAKNMLRTPRTL